MVHRAGPPIGGLTEPRGNSEGIQRACTTMVRDFAGDEKWHCHLQYTGIFARETALGPFPRCRILFFFYFVFISVYTGFYT